MPPRGTFMREVPSQTQGLIGPRIGAKVKDAWVGQALKFYFGTTKDEIIRAAPRRKQKQFEDFMFAQISSSFEYITKSLFQTAWVSFKDEADYYNGKKWAPLKKSTQNLRSKTYGLGKRHHPILQQSGALKKVATGGNMRTTGKPGTRSAQGIKVSVVHQYKAGQDVQAGTFFMFLTGDKAKHLYGYSTDYTFKDKQGKSTTVTAQVPARPWWPKMGPSFFKSFQNTVAEEVVQEILINSRVSKQTTEKVLKNKSWTDLFRK